MLLNNKNRILYGLTACVIMLALMTPSAIKIMHALENHKHEVCQSNSSDHFHQYEFDCEFSKFKLSPQFSTLFSDDFPIVQNPNYKDIFSIIYRESSKKTIQNPLRGPPSLV